MPEAKIGVIGGSGLYDIPGIEDVEEIKVDTPFGPASDAITVGRLGTVSIAFLPRHGRGHRISPSEIPVRANIWALKSLGVERIIGVSACGSFKEEMKPGDLLIPDQLIDRTKGRVSSFFTDGIVAHIIFAEPFCPDLSRILFEVAQAAGVEVHRGGTYVTMEGPAFSTRAESLLHKSWGADVIGMTVATEAKLAREAEICYASICGITDYDCWKEAEDPTPIDVIVATLSHNTETIREIIKRAVTAIDGQRNCGCATALEAAIVTAPEMITPEIRQRLGLIIDKYVK